MNNNYEEIMFEYIKMLKDRIKILEEELSAANKKLYSKNDYNEKVIEEISSSKDEEIFDKKARARVITEILKNNLEKALSSSEEARLAPHELKEVIDNDSFIECKTFVNYDNYDDKIFKDKPKEFRILKKKNEPLLEDIKKRLSLQPNEKDVSQKIKKIKPVKRIEYNGGKC